MATSLERAAAGRDKTYHLCRANDDFDGAVHWSHYNGAFTVLFMLASGDTVEEILAQYEDDLAEYEED